MSRTVTQPPIDAGAEGGVRAAGWWREVPPGDRVQCVLCPRGCVLRPGDRGYCYVRENRDGAMVSTTYGLSTGFCIDPIEKKPLNHFHPGTPVLSFGTPGCNLGCRFCQNWTISRAKQIEGLCVAASPAAIAEAAKAKHCRSVAFTYNDPIIWAEYAIDTARECRRRGVKTVAVTSGYIGAEARGDFFAEIDAANVDLKAFSEEFYVTMTAGHLQPVLDTLEYLARQTQVWLEITTLLVPRANDSAEEIARMCDWLVSHVGVDVPLHFTAFHPDFQMADRESTPLETVLMAHEIARRAGLRYVYTGNVFDPEHQHTYCWNCGRLLIERRGYALGAYFVQAGRCAFCAAEIAGHFDDVPGVWGNRRQAVAID